MKILLTGGAGFIGSNILQALNAKGLSEIYVSDNLSNSAKYLNIAGNQFADYFDKNDLPGLLPKLPRMDLVIHQGACSSTTNHNGVYMMKNNYEYSKYMLEYCMANHIPLIYASSAAVYGDGKNGFDDRRDDYTPLNIYGYSKLLFDRYLRPRIASGEIKIPVFGLRYFNVYGYQEGHKDSMASVICKFYKKLQEGAAIELFEGSDKILRDFIFVNDIVNIVLFFMGQVAAASGIYNCGTGRARSFQAIADVFKKLNPAAPIKYIPFPEILKGKYQYFTEADMTLLLKSGYDAPFTSLEDGVTAYYEQLVKTGGYLNR
jgi:ADP-L-glycero-D-manno-heptose 6-epimerase